MHVCQFRKMFSHIWHGLLASGKDNNGHGLRIVHPFCSGIGITAFDMCVYNAIGVEASSEKNSGIHDGEWISM